MPTLLRSMQAQSGMQPLGGLCSSAWVLMKRSPSIGPDLGQESPATNRSASRRYNGVHPKLRHAGGRPQCLGWLHGIYEWIRESQMQGVSF